MGGFGLYIAFLIPPLVFGLAVQWWLKRTFAKYSEVPVSAGMSGAQVARAILDRNGLSDVPVEISPGGALSDHYDPRKKALFPCPSRSTARPPFPRPRLPRTRRATRSRTRGATCR